MVTKKATPKTVKKKTRIRTKKTAKRLATNNQSDRMIRVKSSRSKAKAAKPDHTTVPDNPVASEQPEIPVLSCPDSLDISMVEGFYGQLQQALQEQGSLLIDGSRVERADAAALQTLYAFLRQAKDMDMQVQWRQPSEALHRSARLLGLSSHLGLGAG